MFIGTLAIAGIPPLSGFFSKDEILYRAFLGNKVVWVLAVLTAFMTAFYMFRLMAMTFFGAYRGPAWETARPRGGGARRRPRRAASVGFSRARAGAPGKTTRSATGPADSHGGTAHAARDAGGHGHGPWHGPHESPTAMTFPLMVLAVGAIVAGLVGIPAALGGGNDDRALPGAELHRGAAAAPAGEAAAGGSRRNRKPKRKRKRTGSSSA